MLVIPGPPPLSQNQQERMHWAQRRRLRVWWAKQAWYVWLEAGRPRFERVTVQYRLFFETNRYRDDDNYVGGCKPVLDGLKGHAFPDDDSRTVTVLPPVFGVDRDKPRTEIVIRDAKEGVA